MLSFFWKTLRRITCTLTLLYHLCVFLGEVYPTYAVTKQVLNTLRQYHIIPDVIDVAPTSVVQVRYPNHEMVKIGEILNVQETAHTPQISWPAASDGYYTLILTDPDSPAPLAPKKQEFLHWLVFNIKGSEVSQGETKAEYLRPMVDSKEGIHRYVFTAFRQKGEEKFNETFLATSDIDGRANFSTLKFSEKHEFGYPVAVNFFRVEFKKSAD